MKNFLILLLVFCASSCFQSKPKTDSSLVQQGEKTNLPELKSKEASSNFEKIEVIEINKPSVITVGLTSKEIDQLKSYYGEESFYVSADDAIWYDYQLKTLLDSLQIPIFNSDSSKTLMKTPNQEFLIVKDSPLWIYTYYHFDGDTIMEKEVFELLDGYSK